MTHLVDVNALVALVWASHVHHAAAVRWKEGKALVLCPISELGFIRVSTSPAFNASMTHARAALRDFIRDESPEFIPADSRALSGVEPSTSAQVTDVYLANLAAAHGLKLATFDGGIRHRAVDLISANPA